MKDRFFAVNILRLIFIAVVFAWGMKTWEGFPAQIPLEFNASLKPEIFGVKEKFSWLFVFLFLAIWPMRAEKFDDEVGDEKTLSEDGMIKTKDRKKALILSWIHTIVMCMIFIIVTMLIGKNLQQ